MTVSKGDNSFVETLGVNILPVSSNFRFNQGRLRKFSFWSSVKKVNDFVLNDRKTIAIEVYSKKDRPFLTGREKSYKEPIFLLKCLQDINCSYNRFF